MKLANHTALKEWSSVVEALGRGDQVILIRKGGIADPSFGIEADRFYLYPTYFHQGESDPRDRVAITHWAEVVRTWNVREIEKLYRLEPHVVFDRANLDERFRFRPDQALHVIGVRAYRLPEPADVQFRSEYAGCRSWISVDEEIDVDGSTPVLAGDMLHARLEAIDVLLSNG